MNATLKNRMAAKATAFDNGSPALSENTPTFATEYAALDDSALEGIRENLKNQPMSLQLFDIVKSPSGGTTVFTVPGISGDEVEKSLTGIILDYTMPRAYWDTPEPAEGTSPVCWSSDSLVSHDGKACCECSYNDFGSRDGESNAKACKESVILFLLRPGSIMPLVVRVPASSKRSFQRYITRLIGRMLRISGVVTRITLEKKTSRNGQPYAVYNFEAVDGLEAEDAEKVRKYAKNFMSVMGSDNEVPDKAVIK